jgi:hypothetical protein
MIQILKFEHIYVCVDLLESVESLWLFLNYDWQFKIKIHIWYVTWWIIIGLIWEDVLIWWFCYYLIFK